MEPGYMALSIYCVHMSSKWSCILDSQPIQGKYMSVEVYYDQFCNWKKKLEEVNYIGDEESYIDDFLYGLKMDLAVGVWGCKWKPRTLYGAFRRAEIEETMISWKELPRKNDVDKVFEEMSQPNSINNADTIGAEVVSDEDNYSVVDASGNMATNEGFSCMLDTKQLQALGTVIDGDKVLSGMFKPACAPEAIFISPKARNHLLDEVGQLHSLKLEGLRDTQQLFDAMPGPISIKHNDENDSLENLVLPTIGLLKILSYGEAAPEFHSVKLEGLKNAAYVFDKMLQQFLVKQKNGLNGHENWEPSMVDFPRDLGSKADKMKVGSTNSSSKMMFGEMGVFMFDPGISSWHRRGCGCIKSNGVKHDFDKMPGNSNVELWFGKMLMFVFDPGGSSLFPTGCNSFLFTDDKQHFDKFSGTYWQRFTSTFTFFIKECVKQGHVLKKGYDVDEFFVDYSLDSKVLCKRNVVRSSSGKPFTPFSRVVPILELVVRTQNRIMVMALFEEGFKRVYCDMNSFGGNSNVKSTRESGSERLCDKGIDEILKNFAKLFLYVYCKNLAAYFDLEKLARLLLLDKSEIDRPKVGILTKLQQQHGDKFMSETDGIAAYFTLVCCDNSSSPVCSWMVEFKELLHIRQLRIGSLRHDLIIIHVCWTKLAFSFLPSIQVTLPLDMNLELPTNISRLINSLLALLHDIGKTNDMVDMVVLRVLDLYFEFPYDHAHNHPMESIEYSGWNTEKVAIAEQPLRNRKLADKINLASGIPNTRRQLIQAEFVAVLNGVKEDVYFDDESTEVVKSLLRLRDHHETLFINSSWIDCHDGVTGDAIGMLGNLKNFVWEPGSIRISHFTTLRTRRLLRRRICHVPRLKFRKMTEDALVAVK